MGGKWLFIYRVYFFLFFFFLFFGTDLIGVSVWAKRTGTSSRLLKKTKTKTEDKKNQSGSVFLWLFRVFWLLYFLLCRFSLFVLVLFCKQF